jgi:hypothetical protein
MGITVLNVNPFNFLLFGWFLTGFVEVVGREVNESQGGDNAGDYFDHISLVLFSNKVIISLIWVMSTRSYMMCVCLRFRVFDDKKYPAGADTVLKYHLH